PALRIAHGGHVALGLVQHEIAQPLGAVQQLSIHADVVASGIGLAAQFGDSLAVHLHAAFGDQFLGMAAAGHARLGKNLLQTLRIRGWPFSAYFLLVVFASVVFVRFRKLLPIPVVVLVFKFVVLV